LNYAAQPLYQNLYKGLMSSLENAMVDWVVCSSNNPPVNVGKHDFLAKLHVCIYSCFFANDHGG
jgi:hypothetical protein